MNKIIDSRNIEIKRLNQSVSPVETTVLKVSDLIDEKSAKDNFSVYCDWGEGSKNEFETLNTFCRSLIMDGGKVNKNLSEKIITLKGTGFVKQSFWAKKYDKHPLIVNVGDKNCPNIWVLGCMDLKNAIHEWNVTKYLKKQNFDVHDNLAILILREIINEDGKKIKRNKNKFNFRSNLKNNRTIRRIKNNFEPCIYAKADNKDSFLRLSNASIEDIHNYIQKKGMKEDEYLNDFIEKIAKNLAKLHDLYLIHSAYTSMNIRLDGSFTDNEDFLGTSHLYDKKSDLCKEQEENLINERTKNLSKKLNSQINDVIRLYYDDEISYGLRTVSTICNKLGKKDKKRLFLEKYLQFRKKDNFFGYAKDSVKKKLIEIPI